MAIETDDGWVIDICRQCYTEFNVAERELDEAWEEFYRQLCEKECESVSVYEFMLGG